MTEVAWLQYMPLQNTFILCLSPKQEASILNLTDLYEGESWFKKKKHTFNLFTFVTIRMSMMPDPSVGGGWQ